MIKILKENANTDFFSKTHGVYNYAKWLMEKYNGHGSLVDNTDTESAYVDLNFDIGNILFRYVVRFHDRSQRLDYANFEFHGYDMGSSSTFTTENAHELEELAGDAWGGIEDIRRKFQY